MTAPQKFARRASGLAVVLLAGLLLASCDGIDRPVITPTRTVPVPTVTLPTPTFTVPTPTITAPHRHSRSRPSRCRSSPARRRHPSRRTEPTITLPVEPPVEPTRASGRTDRRAVPEPTPEPSGEATETAVAPAPSRRRPSEPATSPAPSPSPSADDAAQDGGSSEWVWWLVGLVVAGLAIGVPLISGPGDGPSDEVGRGARSLHRCPARVVAASACGSQAVGEAGVALELVRVDVDVPVAARREPAARDGVEGVEDRFRQQGQGAGQGVVAVD